MALSPEEPLSEGDPIKASLGRKRIEELRALAREQGVDISGLSQKADIIDALALHPGIAKVLGLQSSQSGQIPSLDDILRGGDSPTPQNWTETPATSTPTATEGRSAPRESQGPKSFEDMLNESLATTVDFSRMQSLLGEAGAKFQGRNYDAVLSLARDSVMGIDDVTRRYLRNAWGYAISASLKILEDSDKDSEPFHKASEILTEAKRLFSSQNYFAEGRTLEKLHRVVTDLYGYEIQKARQHIQAQEAMLEQIKAMGGEVSKVSEVLRKASEAITANNRSAYLEIITKADDLVTQARNARVSEIRGALAGIDGIIKETKAIGADVTEAIQLHEQARSSMQGGDFINANRLIQRAERVALEAQKTQIDKVTELNRRQVENVKKLIMDTKPLLERARAKGMDVSKAMDLLRQAVDCANRGDYVNGQLLAKEAVSAMKGMVPPEELPREAVPPPPPEPSPGPGEDAVLEISPAAPEPIVPVPEAAASGVNEARGATRCPSCGSTRIELGALGKGHCFQCGAKFRWGRR